MRHKASGVNGVKIQLDKVIAVVCTVQKILVISGVLQNVKVVQQTAE